jgi:hypothetical protein
LELARWYALVVRLCALEADSRGLAAVCDSEEALAYLALPHWYAQVVRSYALVVHSCAPEVQFDSAVSGDSAALH